MKAIQVSENELIWRGFIIDRDIQDAQGEFRGQVSTAVDDDEIVREAREERRTVVTANGSDFVRKTLHSQRRPNHRRCPDSWGLLIVPNSALLRERFLPAIRRGVQTPIGALRWPAIAAINLRVHVLDDGKVDVARFRRCVSCREDDDFSRPFDEWYLSLRELTL